MNSIIADGDNVSLVTSNSPWFETRDNENQQSWSEPSRMHLLLLIVLISILVLFYLL